MEEIRDELVRSFGLFAFSFFLYYLLVFFLIFVSFFLHFGLLDFQFPAVLIFFLFFSSFSPSLIDFSFFIFSFLSQVPPKWLDQPRRCQNH